jgi:hypothetical protein
MWPQLANLPCAKFFGIFVVLVFNGYLALAVQFQGINAGWCFLTSTTLSVFKN